MSGDRLTYHQPRTMDGALNSQGVTSPVKTLKISVVIAAFGAALVCGASTASAATGTANLSAGSLAFVSTPPDVTFAATLTGANQTTTQTQALDVGDATGSGSGWNITATSTTFNDGAGHNLPTTATSVQSAPSVACDASITCATATNSVTYPYTLPAAGSAPTATKLFNAAATTGLGNQTVTPTWRLALPASTFAGSYTSTWTLSLVSAP